MAKRSRISTGATLWFSPTAMITAGSPSRTLWKISSIRWRHSASPFRRNRSKASELTTSPQNASRCTGRGNSCLTRVLKVPSIRRNGPYSGTSTSSSFCLIRLARAGLSPPVEIASVSSSRLMMEGTMKLHSSGTSTTLTSWFRSEASPHTSRLTSVSELAATTTMAPVRSPGWYTPRHSSISPRDSSSSRPLCICGAITLTFAPAASSDSTFRKATSPPPTTIASLPRRSRKAGK